MEMLKRYFPQILISLPAVALYGVIILARLSDESYESLAWVLYLDLIAMATCIAMSWISRETTPWRLAALFLASPIVLAAVASSLSG